MKWASLFLKATMYAPSAIPQLGIITNNGDCMYIFATGVRLESRLCPDGTWRWFVDSFEDDCYMDGRLVEPAYTADTEEGLLSREWEERDTELIVDHTASPPPGACLKEGERVRIEGDLRETA